MGIGEVSMNDVLRSTSNISNTTKTGTATSSGVQIRSNEQMVDGYASKASEQQIKEAVNDVNKKIQQTNRVCEYTYHSELNRVSIKIIDSATEEVVREIPSEDTIEMLKKLQDITGLLIDEQR